MISICGLMIPKKVTRFCRDQAKADYHIIRKQLGIITNVAGMVGDNAQTQTGYKSGLVK